MNELSEMAADETGLKYVLNVIVFFIYYMIYILLAFTWISYEARLLEQLLMNFSL